MADEVNEENSDRPIAHPRGGCVVLSSAESELLGVLLPALKRRWDSMSVVSDEPAVMEALAAGGVSMVVVVEPGRWRWLESLAVAMGRYFGQVLCMKFEVEPGEREPRILSLASRWMVPGRGAGAKQAEEAPGAGLASLDGDVSAEQAPPGRDDMLAATDGADRAAISAELDVDEALIRPRRKVDGLAVPAPEGATADTSLPESLVTEEELSMLLGPGPGEVA